MSVRWVARLPLSQADSAARLRLVPGLRVLAAPPWLWLRGETLDESLDLQLRSTPGLERFNLGDDNLLTPVDSLVPVSRLPEGSWTKLSDWLTVELPASRLAARSDAQAALKFVRSTEVREAGLLLTTWGAWHNYGINAPQSRLDRWTFAVSDDRRTIVRGAPIPPLPGEPYVESAGIAVPCGWRCDPPIDAATAREVLGLDASSLALFHTDGSWERVAAGDFVRATRSALRATQDALG